MAASLSLGSAPKLSAQNPQNTKKKPFFARLLDALIHARQAQAEREIERLVAINGGTMTDRLERQIDNGVLGRR